MKVCVYAISLRAGGRLPARGVAKLDLRLVPNMTVADCLPKLRAHLERHGFGDVEVNMTGGYDPTETAEDSRVIRAEQASPANYRGSNPSVGADGTNWIVVWEDWNPANGRPNVRGARVAPGGQVLDPQWRDLYEYGSASFGFKSRHPGVCQFVFGDGSVRSLSESMNHGTYQLLGAKSDGVTIPAYE